MSFKLYNGDCLEVMKAIPDNSIDLIFCDLPYGCTNCRWDCPIDLDKLWLEYMRIKKLNAPIFLTTTTKFGVSLINSAPKKCHFRYDLIWVKSAPAGFLSAKKMPMRKHEMVYVFYEKLPFYDLSSHKHKFLKADKVETSSTIYNNVGKSTTPITKHGVKGETTGQPRYDPPLPTSVIKEIGNDNMYRGGKGKPLIQQGSQGNSYEPPLPTSVIKEPEPEPNSNKNSVLYGSLKDNGYHNLRKKGETTAYDPPPPTSILEIASQRSKHSTQKPVALMSWVLKYYSKENDIILDNCMGSGSTGVACKEMNRRFIGIEMDKDIFKVAEERLN